MAMAEIYTGSDFVSSRNRNIIEDGIRPTIAVCRIDFLMGIQCVLIGRWSKGPFMICHSELSARNDDEKSQMTVSSF